MVFWWFTAGWDGRSRQHVPIPIWVWFAHWASISSDFLLLSIICMLLFLKFPLQRKQQTSDLFFCRDLAIPKPWKTSSHLHYFPGTLSLYREFSATQDDCGWFSRKRNKPVRLCPLYQNANWCMRCTFYLDNRIWCLPMTSKTTWQLERQE